MEHQTLFLDIAQLRLISLVSTLLVKNANFTLQQPLVSVTVPTVPVVPLNDGGWYSNAKIFKVLSDNQVYPAGTTTFVGTADKNLGIKVISTNVNLEIFSSSSTENRIGICSVSGQFTSSDNYITVRHAGLDANSQYECLVAEIDVLNSEDAQITLKNDNNIFTLSATQLLHISITPGLVERLSLPAPSWSGVTQSSGRVSGYPIYFCSDAPAEHTFLSETNSFENILAVWKDGELFAINPKGFRNTEKFTVTAKYLHNSTFVPLSVKWSLVISI